MNVRIHGDNLLVTEALEEYAERKFGKLDRYFQPLAERDVQVKLSVERGLHRVEAVTNLGDVFFRAEATSDDMYASIDLAADKLKHQILKYKARLTDHARDHHQPGEADHSPQGTQEAKVVRVKRFPVKPLELEEATMQMELLGHDFFVFRNAQTNEVNVLYRRRDGNYGLIEPQ
jgi:putative sigma-54 modulation protein